LTRNRFEATEKVFFGGSVSLPDAIAECVHRSGIPSGKIFLAGKNSLFPGLFDRLQFELRSRKVRLSLVAPSNRAVSAFSGAAAIANNNQDQWMTKVNKKKSLMIFFFLFFLLRTSTMNTVLMY
jgi:hypothetical protein